MLISIKDAVAALHPVDRGPVFCFLPAREVPMATIRTQQMKAAMSADALVAPFRGLCPDASHVAEVIAPPYDVVSTEEARALAEGRRWSFLHVSKPEIDFPPGTDPHAPKVYEQASTNLRRMIEAGVMRRDARPAYYAYRVGAAGHVQTGIAAAGSVAAYHDNRIRRHELTRPDKEDDRVRQILAVDAHTGPVFVVHRRSAAIAAAIASATAAPPALEAAAADGARHALWRIDGATEMAALTEAFEAVDTLYIADGHHRAAAGARAVEMRRNRAHGDPAIANRFLVVSFPDDEVRILDYNRVVRDLGELAPGAFLAKVGEKFEVTPLTSPARPDAPRRFAMYVAGKWYALAARETVPENTPPARRLDVSLLAERLLGPTLGIGDPRTDPRIDFVGGARGLAELARRVDSGEMAVAFALYPTQLAELFAVADAGEIMPPKSTWFEPKLADGLISLPLA
jgi:uncharacterized protein (DUF1015 family)